MIVEYIDFKNRYNYDAATQVMQQYLYVKYAHIDCLLLFRMGDFYELFFEDAITASRILGVALTKRGKTGEQEIAMCGVPYHALEQYLHKLLDEGFKVAICDQLETPQEAKQRGGSKAVVRRDVTRIITPGTIIEEALLNSGEPNYLIAIVIEKQEASVASIDLSTADFSVITLPASEIVNEVARLAPKEILLSDKLRASDIADQIRIIAKQHISFQVDSVFSYNKCLKNILDFYKIHDISAIGQISPLEVSAIGGVLQYISLTQKERLASLPKPKILNFYHFMQIDAATRKNLEIFSNNYGKKKGTLLDSLNMSITSSGQRLLHQYLMRPLLDLERINIRLDITSFFYEHYELCLALRKKLESTGDIERCITRMNLNRITPRDLISIKQTIRVAENMMADFIRIYGTNLPEHINKIAKNLIGMDEIYQLIDSAITENAGNNIAEGGFIKSSYHPKIFELLDLIENGQSKVAALREQYRQMTGIDSLKIANNNILGLFIDVTARHAGKLPAETFIHRQSTVNSIRYTTLELQELERNLVGAKVNLISLEKELYDALCAKLVERQNMLLKLAYNLSVIDVYCNFAVLAKKYQYTRPIISNSLVFELTNARHPVIEQILQQSQKAFVPNDCFLDLEQRVWLITGPNMAGKSTFLRQNALICIMAQIGCFVPASSAKIGIADKIFCRIGAGDDLSRGNSTFMTEMLETSTILAQATANSIIILDEVGRGTSTYDGVSIAWAILEHIHDKLKSRCLFATHYHELIEMENILPALRNYTVDIYEERDNIVFLHKIKQGFADKSYGIHVAQLAGLPKEVIRKAQAILSQLEQKPRAPHQQLEALANMEMPADFNISPQKQNAGFLHDELYNLLKNLNPDDFSPKASLEMLYKITSLFKKNNSIC